ncbi:hypothetical protein O181_081790 [Austropuccinia psidii MF-1]|uniref:Uncharacterized protein n=1 Tax=Austropuccinia psidii MF-1 TaxID=1389203 RepID=A0A9Q3FQP0_9BASI|nr:hypothetical protein [Austropuccinia psidii MF-1]
MSPGQRRDLGFQRNQPEDREGFSRTRRPERGNLGHSSGWQNNEGDNINPSIHTPIQCRPQTRGLERHGSGSSAPPTPQGPIPMENGKQEVQPGIPMGRAWSKFPEDLAQTDRLQRPYDNYQRQQQINDQESPLLTIPGGFHKKKRIQVEKQDLFQPKAERIRPHDTEVVGFGERSAQEPEVVVNHFRISSPGNRNITPTQTEHNIVTSESKSKSDTLWLQMSQYAEQSAKQFAEFEASHERMKKLTASMDKIIKNLQEGHAQLSKASEETNKRLNIVFEAKHHSRRDRDCLDQDKEIF